jgi:hypothetical protein
MHCRVLAAGGQDEAYIRPPERFMPEKTSFQCTVEISDVNFITASILDIEVVNLESLQ